MIRLLLVLFTLVGFLIFSYPVPCGTGITWEKGSPRAGPGDDQGRPVRVQGTLKAGGGDRDGEGSGNIPEDTAVLYVGNHRSYFDILAGYTTVPTLLGFVAKKEMEKIPLLRTWMVNVNCLFLDRKNIKEGLKTILQGIEKVKNGVSIWIFPEGTEKSERRYHGAPSV